MNDASNYILFITLSVQLAGVIMLMFKDNKWWRYRENE
jgi:hypothetical protein